MVNVGEFEVREGFTSMFEVSRSKVAVSNGSQ
jgi:hypothetical protein